MNLHTTVLSNEEEAYTISYKACQRDHRGLELVYPYIAIKVIKGDKESPWVDATYILSTIKENKSRLFEDIDTEFCPND